MIGPLILVCACVLSVWFVLRAPTDAAPARAVAGIIVISTVIPIGSVTDQAMAMTALGTIVLLSLIALARRDPSTPWPPLWGAVLFAAFAGWLILRTLGQMSPAATVLQTSMLASAMALAFVVPLLRADDLPAIADVFLWLLIGHTAFAALEQVGIVDAMWPLRDTALENIDDRANILVAALHGRSQSTFGHPIPFAVFVGVTTLVLVHATAQTRRWRYAGGVLVAVAALLLSGTRSAVAALLAALAAYVVANIRWRRLLAILAGAGIIGIAALVTDLAALLSLDGRFESSVSYLHRTLVLDSWGSLWAQDPLTRVFGSGTGASTELFRSGVVRGAHGLQFFDNAYVSLFALTGIIGLALFCAVLLRSLFGGALAIGGGAFIAVMGFSFDEQLWQFALVMMAFCTMLPRAFGTISRRSPAPENGARGHHAEAERQRPRTTATR